jgi:hypothetical protein
VSYQLGVERKLTEKIEDKIDELPPRELAGALRNVAVSRGISLDKTGRIRGEKLVRGPAGNGREPDGDSGRRATTRRRRDEAGDRRSGGRDPRGAREPGRERRFASVAGRLISLNCVYAERDRRRR